ncbi:hypothetical protein K9U39_16605 [Rhodoblastus acidophilus]|uniref:Uncharacterized protein n=1 Tax=Candidatus Rhodoblastus alkanivorans TaxID=2954117 RepID=A0ABS9Z1F7_9HYPH|nr:hypothetical protein [Candidatus Rhodoblastus alkanivorans]MCI4679931.1 hypothetical protein [Candidatus Rhodoblastus alkanivorans]MCI4681494.1 hypothetical protein [Candidatus Rhodoblastus alkanivorans]MDI4642542.1 hypothetical protein [Rhodoblastus acidophilus]
MTKSVLDYLLEDGRHSFDDLCGACARAMNAVNLTEGMHKLAARIRTVRP